MPMCTYLGSDQYTQLTSNEELNSLLAELRNTTGDDWRLREVIFPGRWPWSKPRKWYDVYNHIGGPEFQVINFYHATTADVVAAYFYGLLGGLAARKEPQ